MSQVFQLLMWSRNCETCVCFGGGKRYVKSVSQAHGKLLFRRGMYTSLHSAKRGSLCMWQYSISLQSTVPADRLNITYNLLGLPQLDFDIMSRMLPNMIKLIHHINESCTTQQPMASMLHSRHCWSPVYCTAVHTCIFKLLPQALLRS